MPGNRLHTFRWHLSNFSESKSSLFTIISILHLNPSSSIETLRPTDNSLRPIDSTLISLLDPRLSPSNECQAGTPDNPLEVTCLVGEGFRSACTLGLVPGLDGRLGLMQMVLQVDAIASCFNAGDD
jgi:hypothetical protein